MLFKPPAGHESLAFNGAGRESDLGRRRLRAAGESQVADPGQGLYGDFTAISPTIISEKNPCCFEMHILPKG